MAAQRGLPAASMGCRWVCFPSDNEVVFIDIELRIFYENELVKFVHLQKIRLTFKVILHYCLARRSVWGDGGRRAPLPLPSTILRYL